MTRILKALLLLVFVTTASGCGVKTIYNKMDWVLEGLVEDYINLTDPQEIDVEKRIAAIMRWHRTTQLANYSKDLLQVKAYTDEGLDYEKITHFYDLLNQRWIAIKERTAPDIADLLLSLNKQQREEMFANIREKNNEYIEEYVDITQEVRNEQIGERLVENFERWLGPLTDEQKTTFWQWVEKFKPVHQDRLESRRAWQKELVLLLNSDLAVKEKRRDLIELFRNPEKFQSPVHKEKLAYNREQSAYLILATPLTPEQKKHLFAQIDYYVKSFNELAVEENSQPQ